MIQQARAKGGPLLVLDAGDSLYAHKGQPAAVEGAALEQARLKARLMLGRWAADGIDAAAVGIGDLALGPRWLAEHAAAAQVPLLGTNLRCEGGPSWPPQATLEAGGRRVLVLAAMPEGPAGEGCVGVEPIAALRAQLDQQNTDARADLVVVLNGGGPQLGAALAAAIPELDLLIDGSGAPPTTGARPLSGGAWALSGGPKGRSVGVATIDWIDGARGVRTANADAEAAVRLERVEQRLKSAERQRDAAEGEAARQRAEDRLRFIYDERDRARAARAEAQARASAAPTAHGLSLALVALDEGVADAPAAQAAVVAAKAEIEAAAVARASERKRRDMSHFAGGDACAACHPVAAAQWQTTAHAQAWTSLQRAHREHDLACWGCHVTGARQAGGPQSPQEAEGLTNVQCEACHGPSAAHAKAPAEAPKPTRAPPVETCARCHDGAQDGGRFDWERYRPQVVHTPPPAGG